MKYRLLSLIIPLVFGITTARAQRTVQAKGKLLYNITERYQVLADTPEVKHGLYQAYFNKKTAIASGVYDRGKRTGIWHFYTKNGNLAQHYNYSTGQVLFESSDDPNPAISYIVDVDFTKTDTITRPIKPGGNYFGYINYIKNFVKPDDMFGVSPNAFKVTFELLISPGGRLADYKIRVSSALYGYSKVAQINLENVSEDDKIFIPATFNGKAIPATVVITCQFDQAGRLVY